MKKTEGHKQSIGKAEIYALFPSVVFTFVFPALIATHVVEYDRTLLIGGIAFYALSWYAIFMMLYMSAAQLYGFDRNVPFENFEKLATAKQKKIWRLASVSLCLVSYASTVYGFAVSYIYLSRIDPKAYNIGELDMFTGVYFSFVTAATVGYGDIVPVSKAARLLVMAEIVMSLIFVIFFFSILS